MTPVKNAVSFWRLHHVREVRLARHRLVESHPVLAVALASPHNSPTLLAVGAAIDRGEAPDSAIRTFTSIDPAAIGFRDCSVSDIGASGWTKRPMQLLWALELLRSIEPPKVARQWCLLHRIWLATGLDEFDEYRSANRPGTGRPMVLEHLFRGICSAGYAEVAEELVDRLAAPFPVGDSKPAETLWFLDYVRYADMAIDRLLNTDHRVSGSVNSLLARYPASELARQWECWRCIFAACVPASRDWVLGELNPSVALWTMRILLPDFDEALARLRQWQRVVTFER